MSKFYLRDRERDRQRREKIWTPFVVAKKYAQSLSSKVLYLIVFVDNILAIIKTCNDVSSLIYFYSIVAFSIHICHHKDILATKFLKSVVVVVEIPKIPKPLLNIPKLPKIPNIISNVRR